jgi:predicted Kef-type K+ transport protein
MKHDYTIAIIAVALMTCLVFGMYLTTSTTTVVIKNINGKPDTTTTKIEKKFINDK